MVEETLGLCCSGGKIFFFGKHSRFNLPDPLKSLLDHYHQNSKYFFNTICVYNFSLQTTSFGAI
jgi:hypothetical protein